MGWCGLVRVARWWDVALVGQCRTSCGHWWDAARCSTAHERNWSRFLYKAGVRGGAKKVVTGYLQQLKMDGVVRAMDD